MKKTSTLLGLILSLGSIAQINIANGGFENWGNAAPGVAAEPTGWYSNKSGSNTAKLGPQLCFQDNTIKRTGTASVRVETLNYFGTAVNGAVTTGVINAPTFNKSDGNIGTVNYSTASDIRRRAFTGRPDSIIGWYQYTSGGTGEQPKVRAILHTGDYWDPETPTTHHPACVANKIGDALWIGPTGNQTTWRRFSVPFNYVSPSIPAYIMINITSSANQLTTVVGSKLWIDDLDVVYNSVGVNEPKNNNVIKVFNYNNELNIDFSSISKGNFVLTIFDITGKIIDQTSLYHSSINKRNLNSLHSGIYLYQINGESLNQTGKLIVD